MEDIRWIQRFSSFRKALAQLEKGLAKERTSGLNEFEVQGVIKSFEFTYELSWNTLKDYFEYQGEADSIKGSRDVFRLGVQRNLLSQGKDWMRMIDSRQQSSHDYDLTMAENILKEIKKTYFPLFKELEIKITKPNPQNANKGRRLQYGL